MDEATLKQQLAEIDAKLASGITTVSADGTSTSVDLAALRRERETLQRRLADYRGRRPVCSRINLGGF